MARPQVRPPVRLGGPANGPGGAITVRARGEDPQRGRQVGDVLAVGIDREIAVRTHLDLGAPQLGDLLVVHMGALEHLGQAPEVAQLADVLR